MSMAFADVILPLWLVASQWVLLFALGLLVIILYRQLGFMMRLKDQGTERGGLAIGEQAPAFDYIPAILPAGSSTSFDPQGSWSLLVFAEPGCVSCKNTLAALERLTPQLEQRMRLLVVTSAEPSHIAAVEEFRSASVSIGQVSYEVSSKLYQTAITPFAYLIDPEGVIQNKGLPGDEAAIRKIVQKVNERAPKVASTTF